MTSEFKTKKGAPVPSSSFSLAKARGPAVPMGSVSCEQVILMPMLFSKSLRKFIITCFKAHNISEKQNAKKGAT
jgi:hypothetical protein